MRSAALLCVALWWATASVVQAQAPSFADQAMRPGLLADLPAEGALHWRHERVLPDPAPPRPDRRAMVAVSDVHLHLSRDLAAGLARLDRQDGPDAARRQLVEVPHVAPNPALLFFLENVMRVMAQQTGGNPDYIRNRIRMTLGSQPVETAPDGSLRIGYRPFDGDPNAARIGAWGALELQARWHADRPLALDLRAEVPDLYVETLQVQP